MKVKIANFIENSLIDVLGEISFVIWFSGCNFRCPWCFSFPLIKGKGKFVEIDYILEKIKENKFLIKYVQATGGEPTLQIDALEELFLKVKEIGLKCSLDTNSSNPEAIKRLVKNKLIDHYATDIKTVLFDNSYWKVIGMKINGITKKIKRSLKIAKRVKFVEIRTTYIPSLMKIEEIEKAWYDVKKIIKNANFVLQQFFPMKTIVNKEFLKEKIVSQEELIEIAKKLKEKLKIKNVYVRSKAGILKI